MVLINHSLMKKINYKPKENWKDNIEKEEQNIKDAEEFRKRLKL